MLDNVLGSTCTVSGATAEWRRLQRQARDAYLAQRQSEVDAANAAIDERIRVLNNLLREALHYEPFRFDRLKRAVQIAIYDPFGIGVPTPKPKPQDFLPVRPGFFARLLLGSEKRFQAAVTRAEHMYEVAAKAYAVYEADCDRVRSEAELQHQTVDLAHAAYQRGETAAVVDYFTRVLNVDSLPSGFPQASRVGYIPESQQLVVEREMPTIDCVPDVRTYRYIRARDAIEHSARPATQRRSIYNNLVAQLAIRTLYVLFAADQDRVLTTIVLNCFCGYD